MLNGVADPGVIGAIRADLERQHEVRTLYCGADLRVPGDIEEMVSATIDAFGAVDILVNNAVVRHTAPIEAFAVER